MKHDYKPRSRYDSSELSQHPSQTAVQKKPYIITVIVILAIAAILGGMAYKHFDKASAKQKTHVAKTVTIPLKIKA